MSGIGMDAHKDVGSAQPSKTRSDSIDDFGVFDDAKTYYQPERHKGTKASARTRTFSQVRIAYALPFYTICGTNTHKICCTE